MKADVREATEGVLAPAAFDRINSERKLALDTLDNLPGCELGRLRRAQVRFSHDFEYPLNELRDELNSLQAVPVAGTLAMLDTEEREYERVAACEVKMTSSDPLVLEDACRLHWQKGSAFLQLDQPQRAMQHLMIAATLAEALDLQNRLRVIQADLIQTRTSLGDADPQAVQTMLLKPMSSNSRRWLQRIHANTLITLGSFSEALLALGPSSDDTPDAAGMRELLHAILKLPNARPFDDPLLLPTNGHFIIARNVRRMFQQDVDLDFTGAEGPMCSVWVRQIQATIMTVNQVSPPVVLETLGRLPPSTVAEKFHWGVLGLQNCLRAGWGSMAVQYLECLQEVVPRFRDSLYMSRVIRMLNPSLHLVLMSGPVTECLPGLGETSILVGQHVHYNGEMIRLPGRTGRNIVLEGAGHPEAIDLARVERRRLQEALAGFSHGQVANAGEAIKYARMLYEAYAGLKDDQGMAAWNSTYQRLLMLLSPDVQLMFAPTAADSLG